MIPNPTTNLIPEIKTKLCQMSIVYVEVIICNEVPPNIKNLNTHKNLRKTESYAVMMKCVITCLSGFNNLCIFYFFVFTLNIFILSLTHFTDVNFHRVKF